MSVPKEITDQMAGVVVSRLKAFLWGVAFSFMVAFPTFGTLIYYVIYVPVCNKVDQGYTEIKDKLSKETSEIKELLLDLKTVEKGFDKAKGWISKHMGGDNPQETPDTTKAD